MLVKFRDTQLEIGKKTLVMGILNITPDSFSDGGVYNNVDSALERAKKLVSAGADILDVGGESTRPGHSVISEEEEISRVIPVIKALKSEFSIPVSIDSYKPNVCEEALKAGAQIINDVWGFQFEKKMADICAKYGAYVVLMHNALDIVEDRNIMEHMLKFFERTIKIAHSSGVKDEMICLDPGIGFGKTFEQNIEVMANLEKITSLGYPVLLGTSRKSMIGKIQGSTVDDRLEGTIATNVFGVSKGIDIIRVHDVEEHVKAMSVIDRIVRK